MWHDPLTWAGGRAMAVFAGSLTVHRCEVRLLAAGSLMLCERPSGTPPATPAELDSKGTPAVSTGYCTKGEGDS